LDDQQELFKLTMISNVVESMAEVVTFAIDKVNFWLPTGTYDKNLEIWIFPFEIW
jgi:hypothetical protein